MNPPRPIFHVGIIVAGMAAAQAELGKALGLTWRPVRESHYGAWKIRVCYSVEGAPWVELIEGPAEGPWKSQGAPRLDHIGLWSEDVAAETADLLDAGFTIDFDPRTVGKPPTFCYLLSPAAGTRMELVSTALRQLRGLE